MSDMERPSIESYKKQCSQLMPIRKREADSPWSSAGRELTLMEEIVKLLEYIKYLESKIKELENDK